MYGAHEGPVAVEGESTKAGRAGFCTVPCAPLAPPLASVHLPLINWITVKSGAIWARPSFFSGDSPGLRSEEASSPWKDTWPRAVSWRPGILLKDALGWGRELWERRGRGSVTASSVPFVLGPVDT